MKNLRNILFHAVPGEAAAPALARVAALARKSDAILTVAGVLEEIPRELWMLVPPIGAGAVTEMAAAELLERLELLVEPHRRRGIEIDTEVLLGDPCRELVRAIERRRHDLLVVGMGEQTMSRRGLVRLLKAAPCPVWIARPGATAADGNILAAVEPGRDGQTSSLLCRRVMETAGPSPAWKQRGSRFSASGTHRSTGSSRAGPGCPRSGSGRRPIEPIGRREPPSKASWASSVCRACPTACTCGAGG